MPKVFITNGEGVSQKAGGGGLKITHGSVSGSAGEEGLRIAGGGFSALMHMVQGTCTVSSSTTDTAITSLVPQGSSVMGGTIEMTTAAHRPFSITSVGNGNDTDAFSGTIAVSSSAGNKQVIAPIVNAVSTSTGSSNVLLVHGDSGTSWPGAGTAAGTTVTEGIARVTLFCVTAKADEG